MNKREPVEKRMTKICNRLGFAFTVVWTPSPDVNNHGKIDLENRVIHIFDMNEKGAWETLTHELLELKLRPLLSAYRTLTNMLIEVLEKIVYNQKERFLESLPEVLAVLSDEMEKANAHE